MIEPKGDLGMNIIFTTNKSNRKIKKRRGGENGKNKIKLMVIKNNNNNKEINIHRIQTKYISK